MRIGTVSMEPPPPIKPNDKPINTAVAYPAISTLLYLKAKVAGK
jgi:hypothetical protein